MRGGGGNRGARIFSRLREACVRSIGVGTDRDSANRSCGHSSAAVAYRYRNGAFICRRAVAYFSRLLRQSCAFVCGKSNLQKSGQTLFDRRRARQPFTFYKQLCGRLCRYVGGRRTQIAACAHAGRGGFGGGRFLGGQTERKRAAFPYDFALLSHSCERGVCREISEEQRIGDDGVCAATRARGISERRLD